MTPSEYIYGFRVREGNVLDTSVPVSDVVSNREALRQEAVDSIRHVSERTRLAANEDLTKLRMEEGDHASLLVGRNSAHRIAKHEYSKFDQQKLGPFRIEMVISNGLAYRLALPSSMKIYPVILITHLEPAS